MSFFEKLNHWAKGSTTLKLAIIGLLILILLIPSSMIDSLVWERQSLRNEAQREVGDKWGLSQTIGGPVLSVPYEKTYKDDKDNVQTVIKYAHFLPDKIKIDGQIDPIERHRGIFVIVLYNGKLKVNGSFAEMQAEKLGIDVSTLKWDDAFLSVGISDLKGVQQSIRLSVSGDQLEAGVSGAGLEQLNFGPGTISRDIFASGVSVVLPIGEKRKNGFEFSFELDINGSTDIHFLPMGRETEVTLNSNWQDPSFEGNFLPDTHDIGLDGFTAYWKILQLQRNYPQQGLGNFIGGTTDAQNRYERDPNRRKFNSFGVKLILPVDEYQKTQRSSKYATFFIFITFLVFFFIEILNKKRLHPIQYLLVGAAIILFYILLLSISEHFSFNKAYLVSSATILGLITFYCKYILNNARLTLLMFTVLAILYGFFYSLLQLQDYALLLGSIGLLLILATVMYITRNIDWYAVNNSEIQKLEKKNLEDE